MESKKPFIGGQAVIEGVMMKSPNYLSIAVRKQDKSISIKTEKNKSLTLKNKILGLPFMRGIISLFEMMYIGMNALTYSANEALDEDEEMGKAAIILTVIFALLVGLSIFVVLPYILTTLVGISEDMNAVLFNIVDGIVKLIIFLIYVYFISFMEDIKRVFQYHGAEHKAVNCYEAGEKLTIKNAMKHSTLHPRCGTSFLLIVILIGIVFFSVAPLIINLIYPAFTDISWWLKRLVLLLFRIILMLPIAGVAYEFLRLSAKFRKSIIMEILFSPGMLVQKLTTRQPSEKQQEVAIKALKEVLKKEKINF